MQHVLTRTDVKTDSTLEPQKLNCAQHKEEETTEMYKRYSVQKDFLLDAVTSLSNFCESEMGSCQRLAIE